MDLLLEKLESVPTKKIKKSAIDQQQLEKRPLIFYGKSIYVFMQKCNKSVNKFMRDVCDPISKPQKVHEYRITKQSLVRAQALGYKKHVIIQTFSNNMQNKGGVPLYIKEQVEKYVQENDCQLYLVWTGQSCYYRFEIQKSLYYKYEDKLKQYLREQNLPPNNTKKQMLYFRVLPYKHIQLQQQLQDRSMPVKADRVVSSFMPDLKKLKLTKHVPYCHQIQINLKSFTQLRQYQGEALNAVVKVQGDEISAKSGYIVLPCGAGKTLLGISILCKIKKQSLIVCSSDPGTQQWKRQIQKWTQSFSRQEIVIITSDNKYKFKNSVKGQIFVSTYSFLKTHINLKKKDDYIQHDYQWIVSKPWGLVIFDQCQTLPAKENRQICTSLSAQVKIGLTATPLRQDDQFKCLNFMIGPQLYVGDWRTFVEQGYLANPKCIQVRTELTPLFKQKYRRYQKRQKQICYKINPNKVKALLFLLHHHQSLDDHILVFSDDIAILNFLASSLQRPILAGSAKAQERMFIFDMFRKGKVKTLFLSRIGDEAIDLPNANVGIQLNIHHGSRKQMLQRLGRIMRQKQASSSLSYNAMFYTITTFDTFEWTHFFKRYRCLIDQGFHYDLRLFQFRPKQIDESDNILKLDPKIKQIIEEKFKKIIGNQEEYWNNLSKKQKQQVQN